MYIRLHSIFIHTHTRTHKREATSVGIELSDCGRNIRYSPVCITGSNSKQQFWIIFHLSNKWSHWEALKKPFLPQNTDQKKNKIPNELTTMASLHEKLINQPNTHTHTHAHTKTTAANTCIHGYNFYINYLV